MDNDRKCPCKKCKVMNDYNVILSPNDFLPKKFFICWYCKTRNIINAETGKYE